MIRPINDLVYITPIEDSSVSQGGIIIPDSSKERIDQGIVKYKGPEVTDNINIGDYVLIPNYAGTLMYVEGEEDLVIIMKEKDIVAILEEPRNLSIPGLYFKQSTHLNISGESYFEADYTTAMRIISETMSKRNPIKASAHPLGRNSL